MRSSSSSWISAPASIPIPRRWAIACSPPRKPACRCISSIRSDRRADEGSGCARLRAHGYRRPLLYLFRDAGPLPAVRRGSRRADVYPRSDRTAEQMKGLDALVFELMDIGARFYTYSATLGHCLQSAAEAGVPMYILDQIGPPSR